MVSYDRSIFNKHIMFRPKLLYHGSTLTYFSKYVKNGYFLHEDAGLSGSEDKEVWLEKNPKKAVEWACVFAKRYKTELVILIINTKGIEDLRRNFLRTIPCAYHRIDKIPEKNFVMIKLEFKNDEWKNRIWLSPWRDLTDDCKKKIIEAEIKMSN